MSVSAFLATGDLTQPQLFDLHNRTTGYLPHELQQAALTHLTQVLTARCLTISRSLQQSMFGISKSIELAACLISLNSHFKNDEWTDRLTWRMTRLIKQQSTMIQNPDIKQKSQLLVQKIYWQNLPAFKVSSGLIP